MPLEPFVAGAAHLDLLDPLGEEDLVGSESTRGVGVQDRVNDITALALEARQQLQRRAAPGHVRTRRSTSIGL